MKLINWLTKDRLPGYKIAVFTTIVAFLVVGLGAYTRLVHAGLGCPDWPGCYGFATVPETPVMINIAETRFPGVKVDTGKGWSEMIHRYVAGSLVLLTILLSMVNIRYRKNTDQPLWTSFLLTSWVIFQAILGKWTVTLKLWPQVVTFHLLGGFLTVMLAFLLKLRLSGWKEYSLRTVKFFDFSRKMWIIAMIVLCLQIAIGGWQSANYAATSCPDFPSCQGQWWPDMDFAIGLNIFQSIGPDYLGGQLNSNGRVAIHIMHRIGAIIATLIILLLCKTLWSSIRAFGAAKVKDLSVYVILLISGIVGQIGLGIGNILLGFPIFIAVLHNLVGVLLLLLLTVLGERLWSVQRS